MQKNNSGLIKAGRLADGSYGIKIFKSTRQYLSHLLNLCAVRVFGLYILPRKRLDEMAAELEEYIQERIRES